MADIPTIQRDERVQKKDTQNIQDKNIKTFDARTTDTTTQDAVNQADAQLGTPAPQESITQTPAQEIQTTKPQEQVTLEAPKVQEDTKVATEEKQPITDIAGFKSAGGTIDNLQELIDTRYGVSSNIKDGAVMAEVNGELLEWRIDKGGNPRKISQGRVDDKYSVFARENGIKTQKVNGQTYFEPQSMEEALDLYSQFGGRVPLTRQSIETIKASTAYNYFSQYKGASSDVLFEGMKSGELGTGGETWEMLSKINGGQPTLEMIDAQKKFEEYTKLSNVNGENKIIFDLVSGKDVTLQSASEQISTQIAARDAEYQTAINNVYKDVNMSYSEFKNQNQDLSRLNNEVNDISSQIDELNTDKRKVWDEIEKEFPGITRSSAIDIYNQRVDAIDDQLYVLQRDFNNKSSSLNYQESLAQSEYEYKLQRAENQYKLITDMYNIERGDLIDQRAVARADEQLKNERAYIEEQRKQAIIDGDEARAKELTYQTELLEEKAKIQQKFTDYQFTTPASGVIAKMNPATGEIEFIEAPSTTTGGTISSGVGTTTSSNFSQSDLGARTNRHNNPTAFTTAVAKQAGLVEGVDYVVGDSFPDNPGMFTAKIIGDPIEVTKKVIDSIGFYTQSGSPRWDYVGDIFEGNANEAWANMDEAQKQNIIEQMYQRETDNAYENFGGFLGGTMGDSTTITENINGSDVVLGSIGVPIDFERVIKNQIPATLLNSEVELKAANDVIKNLYEAGVSKEEAAALYQGFKIEKPEDMRLGLNLLSIARTIPNRPESILSDISSNINTGGIGQAVGYIESLSESTIPEGFPKRTESKLKFQRLNSIENFINNNGGPGVLEGTWQKFVGNLKDTDIASLETMMSRLNAEERLRLFGTSQTGGEEGTFNPLKLDINEKVSTIMGKISSFKTDELNQLNSGRSLRLPKLNEEQVINDDALIELYKSGNMWENTTQIATQTTSNFNKAWDEASDEFSEY